MTTLKQAQSNAAYKAYQAGIISEGLYTAFLVVSPSHDTIETINDIIAGRISTQDVTPYYQRLALAQLGA